MKEKEVLLCFFNTIIIGSNNLEKSILAHVSSLPLEFDIEMDKWNEWRNKQACDIFVYILSTRINLKGQNFDFALWTFTALVISNIWFPYYIEKTDNIHPHTTSKVACWSFEHKSVTFIWICFKLVCKLVLPISIKTIIRDKFSFVLNSQYSG